MNSKWAQILELNKLPHHKITVMCKIKENLKNHFLVKLGKLLANIQAWSSCILFSWEQKDGDYMKSNFNMIQSRQHMTASAILTYEN